MHCFPTHHSVHSVLTAGSPHLQLRSLLTAALALLLLSACGGDSENGPPEGGSMTALVNGTRWTATSVAATRGGGFIGLAGNEGSTSNIAIGIPDEGPGVYLIPETVGMNANYSEYASGYVWQALGLGTLGGTGTARVEVRTLTESRIAGSFEFSAPAAASSGASGTRVVTEGEFDIEFP